MNKKLNDNLELIFDFAQKWAEGGGAKGIEMETFNEAKEIIYKEIHKLEYQINWTYEET